MRGARGRSPTPAGVRAAAEAVWQAGPAADPAERERLHLLLIREARRAGRLVPDLEP